MRTRAATARLIRSQLEFSGDAALRGHIWVEVRTAYSETLQERTVSERVFRVGSNKIVRWAAAAVLIAGLLALTAYVVLRDMDSRSAPLRTIVATQEPNAGAAIRPQTLAVRQLAEARRRFEAKDLAGLVQLLNFGLPETQVRVAEYLGQIGDESVLPTLQRLAAQWQGPAADNPFRKAIEAIQGRRTKAGSRPVVGESDPNRAAGKPVEGVGPGAAAEVKQLQVAGVVLDQETRQPIAGAQVGFQLGARTVTDAEGRFTLAWPDLSYSMLPLCASAPGYAAGAMALRSKGTNLQEIVVTLGPGSRLAVTVVDPNGSPVPDAKLRLAGLQTLEWDFATDANGQFAFAGLDPAVRFYNVEVMHPAYPFLLVQIPPPAAGQTLHQKVVLKPGVVVLGQVTDPNGRPVAGATVGNTNSGVMWNCVKARTDEQGRYQLGAVDHGELILWATHERFHPFVRHVTLPAQESQRRIDIQLDLGRILTGRVVDDLGNPVPQATVKINRYNEVSQPVETDHPCDADGRFAIPNAPGEGVLGLSVSGPGIIGTSHTVDFRQAECVITIPRLGRIYGKVLYAVTGEPVPRFNVKMSRGQAVTRSGGYATTWSREGHDFDSIDGLFDTSVGAVLPVGGAYRMTVQAHGYDPVTIDPVAAQPISDHPPRTEFRLRPATVFAGRVLAPDGRPLEGATVLFFSNEEASHYPIGRWPSTATNTSGVYTVTGLRPEPQCLLVSAPGFGPRVFVMTDLLAAPGRLGDIVLEPAASLVGGIVDQHGKGIANAQVRAQPDLERIQDIIREVPYLGPVMQTDAAGHYQLSGVPTGKVSIYVYLLSEHREIGRSVVDLQPGETRTLDFVDQGGPAGGPLAPPGTGP